MQAEAQPAIVKPEKPRIPVWLVILYILALASILAWPIVAFMSVFAFDAPGTAEDPAVWTGVITVLSYPLLPLIGIPASFFVYRARHPRAAYVLAAIGSIPLAAVLLFFVAAFVGSVWSMLIMRGGI